MTMTSTSAAPHAVGSANDADWWRQAAVYQIYPRSFADANGDGVGDLRGIISKVPYLQELGVDAVWLSPFYPSALADGGYDVDDYRDVDPRIGTLAEFDEMVAALHGAGIKVVVDIVPNHSSDRHAWFQEALASPKGSAARARYIFRDGKGADGELPPNDWTAIFGGGAWERVTEPDGTPGQWYFHLFAKEQPDLNWDNPEVREDFLTTLRFWADRGVDGFRIDVAHGLTKNLDPAFDAVRTILGGHGAFRDGEHPIWDRDEVHEIYAEWRKVFNEYEPPRTAVAEAWVQSHRRARYASPEGLGQAFNFDLLQADFDAAQFRKIIEDNLRSLLDLGLLEPRRRPAFHPLRPPEGLRARRRGRREGLAARRRRPRRARHPPGPAPGQGRDPAHARPPRFRLPLPGRGAGPPGGRPDPGLRPAGPVLLPQPGRGGGPRRLPCAAAVGSHTR